MLWLGSPDLKRRVQIKAPFYQAGLAGYSDAAMRLIARQHGCPCCVTEALLDHVLLAGGKALKDAVPPAGDFGRETPLVGQIMGSVPEEMAAAAKTLVSLGYDIIDLNFACPVKKVRKKARGGHLISEPQMALGIVDAVMDQIGDEVPVTLKLRRAFDDTSEMQSAFTEVFEGILERGVAGATVHGRSVAQKYKGPASWTALRELREAYADDMAVRHFVLGGSGDIWGVKDIFRMLDEVGLDWISVARGCIGNPWIFAQAQRWMAGDKEGALRSPSIHEQRDVLEQHFRLSVACHGEDTAGRMMRKFGIMFSRHHPKGNQVRKSFIKVTDLPTWHGVLEDFYQDDGPGVAYEDALPPQAEFVSCDSESIIKST